MKTAPLKRPNKLSGFKKVLLQNPREMIRGQIFSGMIRIRARKSELQAESRSYRPKVGDTAQNPNLQRGRSLSSQLDLTKLEFCRHGLAQACQSFLEKRKLPPSPKLSMVAELVFQHGGWCIQQLACSKQLKTRSNIPLQAFRPVC